MNQNELIQAAKDVAAKAYVPYSKFHVGAALVGVSGKVYTACNVENASYGLTCCAERNAVFQAVAQGETQFTEIVIFVDHEELIFPPCGACRQVLHEFAPEMKVTYLNHKEMHSAILKDLLPAGFEL